MKSTGKRFTAIVDGVRAGLLVRMPTKMSYAQARQRAVIAQVSAPTGGGEDGVAGLPAEFAAARAEILRSAEGVNDLSAELDKASRDEPSASLAQIRSAIEDDDRWRNRPLGAGTLCLGECGGRAVERGEGGTPCGRETYRRGPNSGCHRGGGGERPACASVRACAGCSSRGGVAADKLRTSNSQGEYVASTSTASGRAQNRGVDVVFAHRAAPVAQNGLDSELSSETSVAVSAA
jgi:hypothetical protein